MRAAFSTASVLALTVWLPASALAADYTATDDASLRGDITTANGDGDAASTITLGNDVTLAGGFLATPAKPITIDTGSHTLTSVYLNGNNVSGAVNLNGSGPFPDRATFIFNGTIQAASAAAAGNGDQGIFLGTRTSATNNGTVIGGNGGSASGAGGAGVNVFGSSATTNSTFINNGTVRGGNSPTNAGGAGVSLRSGSTFTNNGTVQGGTGQTTGGAGVSITGLPAAATTLINNSTGIIIGGDSTGGTGAAGVNVGAGLNPVVNSGTITGGNGAAAITYGSTTAGTTITNSGSLNAGAGSANAILVTSASANVALRLILLKGSVINGNVVGNTVTTNNTLTLGGDGDASFDVSAIGPQYQNFEIFNKTGNSTWTLTGTASATTPWTISAGTLKLGDGITDGSTLGDVTDNATFAFNNSGTTTYVGAIGGTGAVTQTGSGITILTGANSYTGGTTIGAGRLQLGDGGTAGSIMGDVADNGTLAFNRSDSVTFGGAIAGIGAVNQIGNGTTILTGSNTYTGGTVISAGTLQIGDGGTTGSITGNVTDNGTLAFNRSDSVTFAGAISGTGTVNQIGTGTTILTGNSRYTGGTVISAGTLQLGDDGTTGSITGNVTDNGTLAFNRSDSITFAGAISGTGAVNQTGSGITILTAENTYTGGSTISAGTLQLGGGGTTGSVAGDVADNGTLVFNRSDSVTFGGTISGTGAVNQIGSGTTILTAENTYTGGTTITAGTLQLGDGGTMGSIAGDVADNGTLTLDRSDTVTFGGTISGTGAVNQIGTGTTVLTGHNTYTGGTTISAGTLQLGNGGTNGGITGDVTDNGTLAFNRSDSVTFGGAISGTGAVNQTGTGTTTLTGTNTYTGGTTIAAGTLTGSATSFGTGAILDNAALVIDQPSDAAFANPINGSGSFTKQGAGRLNYTGSGTLTGPTTIAAGTLAVNGSLADSAVTVRSGATLGGNGTVGATAVLAGGTVAPGNSIGTLHVNGAFTQNAGSVYQVEVDPTSSAADLILVNGTATIAHGAAFNVTKNPAGDYRTDAQYTVLTASGGVSGSYAAAGDVAVSQYLALETQQDANNVYLRVIQTGDPASAADTSNQASTATGTDSLSGTSPVGSAVLNTPDPGTTRSAFDALSGEALASTKGVLISSSVLVRDVTFDRLRDVLCTDGPQDRQNRHAECVAATDRPSLWVQGFGDWGHMYGDANTASVSQTSGGFLVGADVPVWNWRLGVFGGYSRTDFDVATRASSGASDTYHLGAYGGTRLGEINLRLGASYSWSGIDTERMVAFDSFSDDLRASYNAGTTQIFGEAGRTFQLDNVSLEPFANLAYVNLGTEGFSETGGVAALTSRANTAQDTFTTIGVRPSTEITVGSVGVILRGMAGWRHAFGDITPNSIVSFAGGNAFTVAGAPIAEDAGVVEAGLGVDLSSNAAIGLTYGGQFSNRETDHSVRGTLSVSF